MHSPYKMLDRIETAPKLLFYTHALVGGGAERVWAQTAAALCARGYDVQFAVDRDASENAHLLPEGMKQHRLGSNHFSAVLSLAKILRTECPTIAFSAVGASNLKLMLAKAIARSPVKVILSQHGHYEAESRFLGRASYRLSAITSRLSAHTIVVSDALRDDLISRWKAAPDRVLRLYNAIELTAPTNVPTARELAERSDTVLTVGRLVPEKGHADLLQAMTLTKRPARLVIAGEGPERANLLAVISKLGLQDRATLVGYHKDLTPFYKNAKMLALPSHTEAFGNVVAEALGFGLPVVSTRCGGPTEILQNGTFGHIVPIADAPTMAAAIDETLTNPGEPAVYRKRAEDFSLDHIIDEYEMVIAELLRARTRL